MTSLATTVGVLEEQTFTARRVAAVLIGTPFGYAFLVSVLLIFGGAA